jgi:chromosome segregation ATPase
MPGVPDDVNPLADLDEPLAPKAPGAAPLRRNLQSASGPGGPPGAGSPAPPPLPRRSPGTTSRPTGAQPPPVPTGGQSGAFQVPPALPRPSGDPFQEPPEPRPPRGIALDEKLEYFRSILKLKEETLGRARAVYEQRDQEASRLREVAVALRAQLDELLPQLAQFQKLPARLEQLQAALEQERSRADSAETQASSFEQHLSTSDADRRDLARALAEVEAEVPGIKAALEEERLARAAAAEELVNVREQLETTEERSRVLEVEKLEALGNLEAVTGQYHEVAASAERLEAERDRMVEEIKTLTTERDASQTERDMLRAELETATQQLQNSGSALQSLKSEQDWSKTSLTDAQGRVRYLEAELEEARQRAQALEESAAQMAQASSEELAEARDSIAALKAEKAGLEKQGQDIPKLRQALETQLGKTRELQAQLEEVTRRAAEAEDLAQGHHQEVGSLRSQLEQFHAQMQALEERAQSELQTALGREAQARKGLETKLAERTKELQAAQKAESTARQEADGRSDRTKALERQLHAETDARAQAEARLDGLTKELQAARTAEANARAALEAQSNNLGSLDGSLKEERQNRSILEAELKARAQATEAAQRAEKEARAQAEKTSGQFQKLQEALKAEQHKTSALRDQLSAQLGGNSVAEATVKKLTDEIERMRGDSTAVKKVREELVDANRKAMEAQASFQKERREREALQARLAEAESRGRSVDSADAEELEKLKGNVAALKRKLVAAENAAEAAALLKSKVARLEAQIKKKG